MNMQLGVHAAAYATTGCAAPRPQLPNTTEMERIQWWTVKQSEPLGFIQNSSAVNNMVDVDVDVS